MSAPAGFASSPDTGTSPSVPLEAVRGDRLLGFSEDATPAVLIDTVRRGLSYEAFERLMSFLGISARELGEHLSISRRTLARRCKSGKLTPEESDRLLRLARLGEMALVVFEGQQASARRWLTEPKSLLSGESPLERADTEAGAREVENMLFAIEFTAAA